jgi:hypothetical protein
MKKAWDAFHLVSTNFLGNIRAESDKELNEDMWSLYHKLGSHTSLKIHMLHSHLDFFPDSWLVMNTVNFFIRKLQRWKNGIRESGPLPCWLTTVGRLPEMLLSSYTSNKQSEVASINGLSSLHV